MTQLPAFDLERAPLWGTTLIEASAGTGKTYTIAALFVRLLLERELSVSEILVVTYTRAATAELRLRIRKRIADALEALAPQGQDEPSRDPVLTRMAAQAHEHGHASRLRARLTEALRAFDEAPIFTIHGFAQRVLRRHAFESQVAFDSELSEDQGLLIDEIVCDFVAQRLQAADEPLVAALEAQGLNVEGLSRLVKRVIGRPQLSLLEGPEPAPYAALAQALSCARAQLAQAWQQHAAEVQALLARPQVNKSVYPEAFVSKQLPAAMAQCELWSASQPPDLLDKLTPAGLRMKKGERAFEHPFFEACGAFVESARALREALDGHVVAFQHALLEYARQQRQLRSEADNCLGFDDLVQRLSHALQGEGAPQLIEAVRGSYKAALIDEFQDTDPLQCSVFSRIYRTVLPQRPAGSLFLIGDPKQAIYGFRGADVFAYMQAARSEIDRAFTLSTNWRSDPGLLHGINQLFGRAVDPFVFSEIEYRPVEPAPQARDRLQADGEFAPLEIALLPEAVDAGPPRTRPAAQAHVFAALPAEVAGLLNAGVRVDDRRIEPRDIAILCRTNRQAQTLQDGLRACGVPAVLDGDASVFDSSMAVELERLLWALCEPSEPARVRAALATRGLGYSADALLRLDENEAEWDACVAGFHRMRETWQARGFMQALHALCDEHCVPEHLFALSDGERRYTDLMHLAELLHAEALQSRKGPRALLDWYRRMRTGEAQRVGLAREDVQIRLESDSRAVMLTTIHRSKGLEFPIVFCPFAWDGTLLWNSEAKAPLFHDFERGERLTLGLPTQPELARAQQAAQREALAENLRLLYVALTRAKHRLVVFWGAVRGCQASAFAHLLSGPTGELPQADLALRPQLAQLAAAAQGAIAVRELPREPVTQHYLLGAEPEAVLRAREPARLAGPGLQISSFSRLAAAEHGAQTDPLEPYDRDAEPAAEPPAQAGADAGPDAAELPMLAFPAGAGFGHLVHSIYETADFRAADAQALGACVRAALTSYAAPLEWEPGLSSAIFETLHAQLAAAGGGLPTLSALGAEQRLCELEFLCPVACDGSSLLGPRRLAQVLQAHARDDFEARYARRLAALGFAPLSGFLRGFIDAVVEHAGRYYILDYKSNLLGPSAGDYTRARLLPAMAAHHYVLQYLVYSVALHRYLQRRLAGYEYARHFGGVYYLFVRGMGRKLPAGNGVFFDRPEPALIEALSALLSSPQGQGP